MTPRAGHTAPARGAPKAATNATAGTAPAVAALGSPSAAATTDPASRGAPGTFAGVLLSHTGGAPSIELQLLEQPAATPDGAALDYTRDVVGRVAAKPVTVSAPIVISGGGTQWSPATLDALADRFGTANTTGAATAVVHYVFVHGTFRGDANVLGVAIRADVIAIFPDGTANTPSLDIDRVLETIYTHEVGHVMGLVDLYLRDGRGDPNDPSGCRCHSPDRDSVMYWSVDTVQGLLEIGPASTPIAFDAADDADLAAIRNGAPKGASV